MTQEEFQKVVDTEMGTLVKAIANAYNEWAKNQADSRIANTLGPAVCLAVSDKLVQHAQALFGLEEASSAIVELVRHIHPHINAHLHGEVQV